MYDQTDEREWILSAKGNHCCKVDDNLVATVFENDYGSWQIIINGDPYGRLVKDEYFKTAEYRDESDIFGQWLDEFCALGAQLAVAQTDAYGSYKEFCVRDGYKVMSKKQFTTTLKERGITDTYQNSKRAYLGITLKGKLAANKQMLDELTVRLEDA